MLCVVSGQTCGAGKTSIGTRLLASTVQADWAVLRISNRAFFRSKPEKGYQWTEESVPNSRTEAGRYLAAGAHRACCLQIADASFQAALPLVRKLLREHDNLLIETSCPMPELPADLSLYVAHHEEPQANPEHWAEFVDAYVMVDPGCGERAWKGSRPLHVVSPASYAAAGLVQMVRDRLRPRLTPNPKLPVLATS